MSRWNDPALVKKNGNGRNTKVVVPCGKCGTFIRIGKKKANKTRYCSFDCYYSSDEYKARPGARIGMKNSPQHIARMSGPSSPRWNPDRENQRQRVALRATSRFVYGILCREVNRDEISPILGYSAADLQHHLESLFQDGMTWETYGNAGGQWNIDHIRPVSSFPIDTQPSIVHALKNLRPLWSTENFRKWKHRDIEAESRAGVSSD